MMKKYMRRRSEWLAEENRCCQQAIVARSISIWRRRIAFEEGSEVVLENTHELFKNSFIPLSRSR
jgi:hypothetical protein